MTKITKISTTLSVLMLEKSYLHQNGVEFNFLFIRTASRPAISLRINPRIREDSKGVRIQEGQIQNGRIQDDHNQDGPKRYLEWQFKSDINLNLKYLT